MQRTNLSRRGNGLKIQPQSTTFGNQLIHYFIVDASDASNITINER